MNFADSGFILDVPNSYANKPVVASLTAVRKDNVTENVRPLSPRLPNRSIFGVITSHQLLARLIMPLKPVLIQRILQLQKHHQRQSYSILTNKERQTLR